MNATARSPVIMVVDDEPANLKLLEDVLKRKNYDVRSFPLGRLAVAAARQGPPDLILLDINMPESNGYEVCQQLKSDTRLSEVPILFLSALQDTQDKVKGFRSGGVDFISKPFEFEEVYARVDTHLKLHSLRRTLKFQNELLEEMVDLRTRELAKANASLTLLDRAKDDFLKIISHELRTPLNGLLGVAEIVLDESAPSDENNALRLMFERSRQRILSLLDDALLLTQIDVNGEKFRHGPVSLGLALSRAVERTVEFAESRGVTVEAPFIEAGLVRGEEDLLVRALHALLETAVKFSAEGSSVRMSCEVLADSHKLFIESHSGTIPAAHVEKFFDVFSISDAITAGGDLGLGPCMASRVLSLFGGTVAVTNREPSGIRLAVTF